MTTNNTDILHNQKLSIILKEINELTSNELMTLNQAVVSLIKTQRDIAFKTASRAFNKSDIVSFIDSNGAKVYGIVTKKNTTTIQVTTQDKYRVNIPATYLTLENKPSKKLLDLRKEIAPTYQEMHEILTHELLNGKLRH
jgi:hypothetical protein